SDYGYTPNPELKGWTNDHPFPPEIEVASPYLARRRDRLEQQVRQAFATAAAKLDGDERRREAFDAWTQESRDFLREAPSGWAFAPLSVVAEPARKPKAARKAADKPAPADSQAAAAVV